MTRRLLSLLTALAIVCGAAVASVSAADSTSGWIDLLEITSVQEDGDNWFSMDGKTGTVSIPLPVEMRLCKIDLLVTNGSSDPPTSVSIVKGETQKALTVVRVNNTTTRIYGNIPTGYYKSIEINFSKSGTGSTAWQMLSCKVSSLETIDNTAQGTLKRSYTDPNPLTLPNNFSVAGDNESVIYEYLLVPVTITDWRKYDQVTLYGSISKMALNSFRASIGNKGLPYEITYMESIPTGTDSYEHFRYEYISSTETNYYGVVGTPDEFSKEEGFAAGSSDSTSVVVYGGSVLYTVTIDLTGIDRSMSGNLECFFTCIANPAIGYAFNVQNASGSVLVADTTEVSWWVRFTSFMRDLFPSKSEEGEAFEEEAENQAGQMEDLNNQLQDVTRPNIEDVETDLEDYVSSQDMQATKEGLEELMNNQLVVSTLMISLTVSLVAYILYGKR